MPDPAFTVVVSTFDRGRHLVPTLQSAQDQTFPDFEVLVVDDGSPTPPASALPNDPRFRLITLPGNSGSQSRPNNAGIAAARGRYVAYLGHDDIWMPDHLACLAEAFADRNADVVVSGCAYHGPPGTDLVWITGIFDGDGDAATHFFPPSALAHRRSIATEIGGWLSPDTIRPPVDADFLLRAASSGASFASTGFLTVHKFAAGHRYLSYLEQRSDEQDSALAAIRTNVITAETCAELVEHSRRAGTFMVMRQPDFSAFEPGQIFLTNRANKGIDRPTLKALTMATDIGLTAEPRALDWYPPECDADGKPLLRWSGPSLRPKLLIPFTGTCIANLTLRLHGDYQLGHLDDMLVTCNGASVDHEMTKKETDVTLSCQVRLKADAPTVLEFILSGAHCPARCSDSTDGRELGLPLLCYRIAPADTGPGAE